MPYCDPVTATPGSDTGPETQFLAPNLNLTLNSQLG